jgi:hypothetical protein
MFFGYLFQARELDKELRALLKEKDGAVRGQDFEKAGQLRDREMELKAQITAITAGSKEGMDAEKEARGEGGGPIVTEHDIANIVCQWTGIPIDNVSWLLLLSPIVFFCSCVLLDIFGCGPPDTGWRCLSRFTIQLLSGSQRLHTQSLLLALGVNLSVCFSPE